MYENAKQHKIIKITSENPEVTVLLASKLLLGKGTWEVSWSKEVIFVMVADADIPRLARYMTSPLARYGIQVCGDSVYGETSSLWDIWKQDARFTEMLATHDLLEPLQEDLLAHLVNSDELDICRWVNENPRFSAVLDGIKQALNEEGKVAEKLQECGWI